MTTTNKVELPAHVFDVTANIALMHQVVVGQLAAARQGTHSTKTRGEVSGGGKKPYRQKGTGRARQGSTRAPQFAGGGVSHGPTPRDYTQKTPKKMKAAALRGALSDRARAGVVYVVPSLVDRRRSRPPRPRAPRWSTSRVTAAAKALVVLHRDDAVGWLSLRNLSNAHLIEPGQLNTYDVLVNDAVVFTQAAFDEFMAGPIATATAAKGSAKESETVGLVKAPAVGPTRALRPQQPRCRWPMARSPRASRSRATRTRCSTTCRAARSTPAPSRRSGSPRPTPRSRPASSCPGRSQREAGATADPGGGVGK